MSSDPTIVDRSPSPAVRQRVDVILFAGMAELAGARRLELEWEGGTVADLRRAIAAAKPALGALLDRSAIAVAGRYAADDRSVPAGTEVAIIPPVSGG